MTKKALGLLEKMMADTMGGASRRRLGGGGLGATF